MFPSLSFIVVLISRTPVVLGVFVSISIIGTRFITFIVAVVLIAL